VVGATVLVLLARRRRTAVANVESADTALSESERARLAELIDRGRQ